MDFLGNTLDGSEIPNNVIWIQKVLGGSSDLNKWLVTTVSFRPQGTPSKWLKKMGVES